MATTPSNTVQVRVEHLVRYYTCLAQALMETGVTGQKLNELFSKNIVAECMRCRIRVTGDELAIIAVTDKNAKLSHPKFERLRCGCCAREGCESFSYFVHFQNGCNIEWRAIAEKAFQLLTAMEVKEREQQKSAGVYERKRKAQRIAIGMAMMTGLLLVRFVWHNGRLPMVHKTPNYQVDASFSQKAKKPDKPFSEADKRTF
jgi:hypothetical protein